MTESAASSSPGRRGPPAWLVPIAILAAVALTYLLVPPVREVVDRAYGIFASGDRDRIEAYVRRLGAWGPALVLLMMLLQTVLTVIPSLLTVLIAVLAFGPVWGAALAWIGLVLAALLGYTIGRTLGPVTVERLVGRASMDKVEDVVRRYGPWAIIAARLSPALPTDALSIVAGLARMPRRQFVPATMVGVIPTVVIVALAGANVERLWLVLIAAGVFSLLGFAGFVLYDRRRRADEGAAPEPQNTR